MLVWTFWFVCNVAEHVEVSALEIGVINIFNYTMLSSQKFFVLWLMNSEEKKLTQKDDFLNVFRERCYLNKSLNPEGFEWNHGPLISAVLEDFSRPMFHFGI